MSVEIIDSQIHVWEDVPDGRYQWDSQLKPLKGQAVTVEHAIASMDAIGVDAAVLNLPPHYRRDTGDGYFIYDNGYAEDAARRYPGRIASAARVDPNDPELEDRLALVMSGEGVLAIRVPIQRAATIEQVKQGEFDRLFAACEAQGAPIMVLAQPYLDVLHGVVERHPDLIVVLDHLAIPQPSETMKMDPEPFQRLDEVLAFAKFDNVSVKFSGAPTLSLEVYPYFDLWPHLHRYVEEFGPERLMWGSDYTRCRGMHNYSEALNFLRYTDELKQDQKALMLATTLRRILRWGQTPAAE